VVEGVEVEVGTEFGVQHGQDVLVERGGDPGGVVVGGDQCGRILYEIGAEQQRVAVAEAPAHGGEELAALSGEQVADGAAEEGDEDPGIRALIPWNAQVILKVGDHGVYGEARILGEHPPPRRQQGRLADVDGHVPAQGATVAQRVKQQAGLVRGT